MPSGNQPKARRRKHPEPGLEQQLPLVEVLARKVKAIRAELESFYSAQYSRLTHLEETIAKLRK